VNCMALDSSMLTLVGILASILILSGWVHQIIKGFKTKKLDDVSKYLMVLIGLGAVLWTVYGIEINDVIIIGVNIAAIILMIIILLMKFRYTKNMPQSQSSNK
jgi:MtN3 and saliva related transmembrane protein